MPLWNDEETSCDNLLSEFGEGEGISPRVRVPATILHPKFSGPDDSALRCKHDLPMCKFVAFGGANTGRKFLGCGLKEDEICDKVHWVDEEWTYTLQYSLLTVWKMYEDEKDTRLSGNVEYATKLQNFLALKPCQQFIQFCIVLNQFQRINIAAVNRVSDTIPPGLN